MSPRSLAIFVSGLVLVALFLTPEVAWATPLKQITSIFDDGLALFLKRIIPGLAIAVIAWTGIMIAMGRKNLMDSIVVIAGAAMALLASVIVGYLASGAS